MKLEIKNKALFAKNALEIFVIILLFACFVWQLKTNISLKLELRRKGEEFKEAKSASKRLTKLQRQIQELEEREKAINNQVPHNENQPLALVRTLTSLAGEIGLKNTVFTIKGSKKTSRQEQTAITIPEQQQGLDEDAALPPEAQPALIPGLSASPPAAGPSPLGLEMNFEGTYAQLLNFLKRVGSLVRVVAVEEMMVERKKEILPYQKVSLQLVTYSFSLPIGRSPSP